MEDNVASPTNRGLMITGIMLWNEPNNLSHWDFQMDPEWREFSTMIAARGPGHPGTRPAPAPGARRDFAHRSEFHPTADRLRRAGSPRCGGRTRLSPGLEPLEIDDWPARIKEIEDVCPLPVWVTEVGASSFGADEVQVFGLSNGPTNCSSGGWSTSSGTHCSICRRRGRRRRVTKRSEGSAYYRHFYLGLMDCHRAAQAGSASISTTAWASASGFISRITGWTTRSSVLKTLGVGSCAPASAGRTGTGPTPWRGSTAK